MGLCTCSRICFLTLATSCGSNNNNNIVVSARVSLLNCVCFTDHRTPAVDDAVFVFMFRLKPLAVSITTLYKLYLITTITSGSGDGGGGGNISRSGDHI